MTRFLADENCESAIVDALRGAGYDVVWVAESCPSAEDMYVYNLACEQGRILVTQDQDFSVLQRFQAVKLKGLLLLRFGKLPRDERAPRVIAAINMFDGQLEGHVLVIEPSQLRRRTLGV